jgi:pilus assembly protein TadC
VSSVVVLVALGSIVAGPVGALVAALAALWTRARANRPDPDPEPRVVMLLLLVELRSGRSVLAALQSVASRLPHYEELRRVTRVATVSGLVSSIPECDESLRPIVSQLARAQRSGAPLSSAVHRLLDQDLARHRTVSLARARALPVKLMIPVTLLMLPGLVLLLYVPDLLRTFGQLTGSWP